ncbi:MAG TPA: diaminopimelate epimerase [Sphingomicrobium sp.]|nr:diaminopimelate epimerase [Sphingomicrobium sp.]
MLRPFHKMHGLGNDFVVIDARQQPVDIDGPLARAIADRQTGVGCDQLILLEPSDVADVKMRIFNHDGSEVGACGNAARCIVLLMGPTKIETEGGIIDGAEIEDEVEVTMGKPRVGWDEIPLAYPMDPNGLPMAWGMLESPRALNVGNSHLVFFVDDVDAVPLDELGPRIEHDAAFPERINVNVAAVEGNDLRLRTWERGVGLTRACGTGACATAVAAIASKRVTSPVRVTMPGGSLTIAWATGETIRMRGPATMVFEGQIDLDALRL